MIQPEDEKYLRVASALAQKAAQEILKLLKDSLPHNRKADNSIVTEADLRSDQIIITGLKQAFPQHAILSEETGFFGDPHAEYVWMIDPLDGTKAYAKGIAGFCVMVGLLKQGKPYLGVVADPLEGHLYEAIQGQGAYHHFQGKRHPVQVSSRQAWDQIPLVFSPNFPLQSLARIQQELKGPLLPPINSVGIKIGLLVRKLADIYLNHHSVSEWDTCAPQVILEEAGGMFTAWDGSSLQYSLRPPYSHERPTLASHGILHHDLVEKLKDLKFP